MVRCHQLNGFGLLLENVTAVAISNRVVGPLEGVSVRKRRDAGLDDLRDPLLASAFQFQNEVEQIVESLPSIERDANDLEPLAVLVLRVGGDDDVHVQGHDQVGESLHCLVCLAVVTAELGADLPFAIIEQILVRCRHRIDHKRAVVVGERTWGKGSVQNVIQLEGGSSALKLTTASYHRPSGRNIHRFPKSKPSDVWGVMPDKGLEVKMTRVDMIRYQEYRRQRDVIRDEDPPKSDFVDIQLAKAVDHLNTALKPKPKDKPKKDKKGDKKKKDKKKPGEKKKSDKKKSDKKKPGEKKKSDSKKPGKKKPATSKTKG